MPFQPQTGKPFRRSVFTFRSGTYIASVSVFKLPLFLVHMSTSKVNSVQNVCILSRGGKVNALFT